MAENKSSIAFGALLERRSIIGLVFLMLVEGLLYMDAILNVGVMTKSQHAILVAIPLLPLLVYFVGLRWAKAHANAKLRAELANQKVTEVLRQIAELKGGRGIAGISIEEVTRNMKDIGVGQEQLARLVKQGKQRLLINEDYLMQQVGPLVERFLQPLPRNAKRFMNRLRINVLIADGRGLFTSNPRVAPNQIGKWLLLMERWPQLGLSLCADPDKMKKLEEKSANKKVVQSTFMRQIELLAPAYTGDENLRRFVEDEPALSPVIRRLVSFDRGSATQEASKA